VDGQLRQGHGGGEQLIAKARARSVMIDVDVPDELPLVNGSALSSRGAGRLDTTRRIVSLIDGQVDFDSVVGRAEFRVSLPVASSNPHL
jgi:nitrogen-specific signal transduction histidine kinase